MYLRTSPVKGLISAGDRVFVTNKYLAWFDNATRRGGLNGIWTINPATGNFKHLREVVPSVFWAHNELVRGSASPYQQTWHWDSWAPPIEHSIGVFNPNKVGADQTELMMHEVGAILSGSTYTIFDGTVLASGDVAYGSGTRMMSINTYHTDIGDFDESNGTGGYIESELAYLCGPESISVVWRFRPVGKSITGCGQAATAGCGVNAYYHLWANYSYDASTTQLCTYGPPAWPTQVWGAPGFIMSNVATTDDVGGSPVPPLTVTAAVRGAVCTGGPERIRKTSAPAMNDWIRWGEAANLASGTPRFTITRLPSPSGYGSEFGLDHLIFLNEIVDGVWGGGGGKWYPTLAQNDWRITAYSISTQ